MTGLSETCATIPDVDGSGFDGRTYSPGRGRGGPVGPAWRAIADRFAPTVPTHLLDPEQVRRWTGIWLQALLLGSAQAAGQYWRTPDRMLLLVPDGEQPSIGDWDSLVRTVDKLAARQLRVLLLRSDLGLDVSLPPITAVLHRTESEQPAATAWCSGQPAPDRPDRPIRSVQIPAGQRLALELRLERRSEMGWELERCLPLATRMTVGSDPDDDVAYHGPGRDRISPAALQVAHVEGPLADLRVGNHAGITLLATPHHPGGRLRLPLRRRRVARGGSVRVSPGDRIHFPRSGDAVRLTFQ